MSNPTVNASVLLNTLTDGSISIQIVTYNGDGTQDSLEGVATSRASVELLSILLEGVATVFDNEITPTDA